LRPPPHEQSQEKWRRPSSALFPNTDVVTSILDGLINTSHCQPSAKLTTF
jgi:hypothetical protein